MKNTEYKKYIQVLILMAISVIISFFIANSVNNFKERNDLPMYSNYYQCINDDISSLFECNKVIGNPTSIIYQSSAFFFKIYLGVDKFYWYLFFLAFFLYFSILYTTHKISPIPIVSALFLLTDFRFWEYGSNILRAGLAISIFMWIFYYLSQKEYISKKIKLIFFFPILAHSSGIVFLFMKEKRNSLIFIMITFSLTFLIYTNFDSLLQSYGILFLPKDILNKVDFYYTYNREIGIDFNYTIPIHYLVIISFSLISLGKGWIVDIPYRYSTNLLWILFLFSILFSSLGMGYRIIGFMPPFLAINFAFQISYLLRKFKSVMIIIILFLFLFLFFLAIFLKNYELIFNAL